ncbi:7,8-didemethyl-8-hydroxy-5-deazariboflavin synthase CofG [bacterium]|nr:7,8-didemethyl-8-hydroxy-5-deazariboflavin synthase CofG [bacterium]
MHGMFEPDAAPRQLDAVDAASRRILDRALAGEPIADDAARHLLDGPAPLAAVLAVAGALRTRHKGRVVTYSPKVFLPITNLCLDRCSYCTFRQDPDSPAAWTMLPEEVRDWSRRGRALGCIEALLCLGDKPERAYRSYRRTLAVLGCDTTIDYVAHCCRIALDEGLLPHTNAGVMSAEEMARLRPLNVSMGLMLESVSDRLRGRGGAHQQAPDKDPALRLAMLRAAGELRIPFTTGILLGIGETPAERVASLRAIAELQAAHGHIQEVIIQNFRAKPSTRMAAAPEPESVETARTIAVARLMMPTMNIQAPPNLSPLDHRLFLAAGINDWGGISPLTLDYVNPEAPWPPVQTLAETCRDEGFTLVPRLPVYAEYVAQPGWLDEGMRRRVDSAALERGARHVG